MELSKIHGLGFLLMVLVVVLIIDPRVIHNMYSNILGRVVLIAVIIIFSMNNVTLGLLVALCIIIASNMFMFEGLENMDSTDGTTETNTDGTTKTETENGNIQAKIVELKKKAKDRENDNLGTTTTTTTTTDIDSNSTSNGQGVDRESIKAAIASKQSNTIPVTNTGSSENVSGTSTTEAFSMRGGYSYLG